MSCTIRNNRENSRTDQQKQNTNILITGIYMLLFIHIQLYIVESWSQIID